ncbi:MAG: zinc ribbon domain-containing protein [Chloroflexi bacterium]|nr:zinc ribbon domain-containing protein [Chloroflexota bacterium]
MIYVLSFILMAGVLGYVALPLFRGARQEGEADGGVAPELEAQKAATYSAIKELQFDYELGNLSPSDHKELEDKYKVKAAQILKSIDEVKGEAPMDDIEKEIARKRRGGRESAEDEIERQVALRRGKAAPAAAAATLECHQCGKPQRPGAKFCSACGVSLSLSCPGCGAAHSPEDKFCSECGAAVKKEKKA